MNEGTDRRGTAILVKDGIPITDIKRIPSGRGMATILNGTWIVNIYAPSGAEKKNERETFYNSDLTYILPTTHADMILADDFNCILSKTDSTGNNNYSRALANIVNGLGLIDAWNTSTSRRMYTNYTATGACRIDRIYATRNIMSKKLGLETVATAFTDHHAVILRIAISAPLKLRGRGYW
jgi:exonuclease III